MIWSKPSSRAAALASALALLGASLLVGACGDEKNVREPARANPKAAPGESLSTDPRDNMAAPPAGAGPAPAAASDGAPARFQSAAECGSCHKSSYRVGEPFWLRGALSEERMIVV